MATRLPTPDRPRAAKRAPYGKASRKCQLNTKMVPAEGLLDKID